MRRGWMLFIALAAVAAAVTVLVVAEGKPYRVPVVIALVGLACGAVILGRTMQDEQDRTLRKQTDPRVLNLLQVLAQKFGFSAEGSFEGLRHNFYRIADSLSSWSEKLGLTRGSSLAERLKAIEAAVDSHAKQLGSTARKKKRSRTFSWIRRALGCLLYGRRLAAAARARDQLAAQVALLQGENQRLTDELEQTRGAKERLEQALRDEQSEQRQRAEREKQQRESRQREHATELAELENRLRLVQAELAALQDRCAGWARLLAGLATDWRREVAALSMDELTLLLDSTSVESVAASMAALWAEARQRHEARLARCRRDKENEISQLHAAIDCDPMVKLRQRLQASGKTPSALAALLASQLRDTGDAAAVARILAEIAGNGELPGDEIAQLVDEMYEQSAEPAGIDAMVLQAVLYPGGVELFLALRPERRAQLKPRLSPAVIGGLLAYLRNQLSQPAPNLRQIAQDLLAFSGPLDGHADVDIAAAALIYLDEAEALASFPGNSGGARLVAAIESKTEDDTSPQMKALALRAIAHNPGFYFELGPGPRADVAAWFVDDPDAARSVMGAYLVDPAHLAELRSEETLLLTGTVGLPPETLACVCNIMRSDVERAAYVLFGNAENSSPTAFWFVSPDLLWAIFDSALHGDLAEVDFPIVQTLAVWDVSKEASASHRLRAPFWGMALALKESSGTLSGFPLQIREALYDVFQRHFAAHHGQPLNDVKRRVDRMHGALHGALVLKQ